MDPNLYYFYCMIDINKMVEFWPNKWVVKGIGYECRIVASRYCDEIDKTHKLGKPDSSNKLTNFMAMISKKNVSSTIWNHRLMHSNCGYI